MQRSPNELLRYIERRLYGHTKLEAVATPLISVVRGYTERQPPKSTLPSLGKGARSHPLERQTYDAQGDPEEATAVARSAPADISRLVARSADELKRFVGEAHAGDTVEVAPGRYRVSATLGTGNPGLSVRPIIVRAAVPGSVILEFAIQEGFVVSQPYWIFENLVIRGACGNDSACEHAFHVVGKARGLVIRNNVLQDFNAQIKVNGLDGNWPDAGLIQFNSIGNSRSRNTGNPVSLIDIVAASRWVVADNVISNFNKTGGSGISYGAYMKGAGSDGRFERNLVICSTSDVSERGSYPWLGERVGISLGNGGTGPAYCRDQRCAAEHTGGIIRNNIVAHCNDSGIDISRGVQATVAHNTLINTTGIGLRGVPSSAIVHGNILEGDIRVRDGGWADSSANRIGSTARLFDNRDSLALGWVDPPATIPTALKTTKDFCGTARGSLSFPGALADPAACR